jgi:hypothetical protein
MYVRGRAAIAARSVAYFLNGGPWEREAAAQAVRGRAGDRPAASSSVIKAACAPGKNLRRAASRPRNNCVAAAAHGSAGIAIFAEPSTPENRSTIIPCDAPSRHRRDVPRRRL